MKYYKVVAVAIVLVLLGLVIYSSKNKQSPATTTQGELGRPLIVGIVSWPGYAPGIIANKGFQENAESVFSKKYGMPVRFVLIEDINARGKAFAKGGPDGVDIVWSTVDFWSNELPNFVDGGIDAKAFMQVDWSRGGDAIVINSSIHSVEDLKNKKIALVQYTPSHWLLENVLRSSKLTAEEQKKIRDNLVFSQDVPSARAAFVAGQVDAAVLWEPDVKQALKKPDSRILTSSKDLPNLIADIMVAKKDFIAAHPKTIENFVRGWMDGVAEARQNPDEVAKLLTENEPLFGDLGLPATKDSLSWVYWPDLADNIRMFGLDGQPALFDQIFNSASDIWLDLEAIKTKVSADGAKDDSFIKKVSTSP
jgi:NitT/TauT family transport system substrate-binding protein